MKDEESPELEDCVIISNYLYNISTFIAKNLKKTFPYFFDEKMYPGRDIHYQVKITGKIKGVEFKGMLDGLIVDHDRKKITPLS